MTEVDNKDQSIDLKLYPYPTNVTTKCPWKYLVMVCIIHVVNWYTDFKLLYRSGIDDQEVNDMCALVHTVHVGICE